MKIIAINKNLAIGGGELLLTLLAKVSIKVGHEFDIILFEKNIEYHVDGLKTKLLSPFKALSRFFRIVLFPYFFIRILFLVRKYDVILTFERYPAYINIALALILKKTSIVYVQNPLVESFNDIYIGKHIKNIHFFLHSFIFRQAKVIISVSEGIKSELVHKFGIDNNKILVIEPWIDAKYVSKLLREDLSTKEKMLLKNKRVLITVGRLNKQKNFVKLIEVLSLISKRLNNILLLIIGEGPEKLNIVKAIKSFGLEDKIVLLGLKNNPFKYMRESDIFVMPSKFEGSPHVLLEARLCNLPIVAVDSPFGVREAAGKYGTLVSNNKNLIKNTADVIIGMLKSDSKENYPLTVNQKELHIINDERKRKWLKLLKSI